MAPSALQIKREFDAFARKIGELESLRQELHALPKKGFEHDISVIEAKLKNVGALPEVKREISQLKARIERKTSYSMGHSKVDVVLVQESKQLKRDTQALKHKLFELEQAVLDRRKLLNKPHLSAQERDSLHEIPNLEQSLHKLKRQFAEHMNSAKVRIDSGVGVLVNNRFDDFVRELKAGISQRLSEKEFSIDTQLKADLAHRERIFAQRYQALVEEFNAKFRRRVEEELRREVRKRFDAEIEKRLAVDEQRLREQLIAEEAKRLGEERHEILRKLTIRFEDREKRFHNALIKEEKELHSAVAQQRMHVQAKMRHILEKEKDIQKEKINTNKILRDKYRALKGEKQQEVKELERKMLGKLDAEKKALLASFREKQHNLHRYVLAYQKDREKLAGKRKSVQKLISAGKNKISLEKKILLEKEKEILALEKSRLHKKFFSEQKKMKSALRGQRANLSEKRAGILLQKQRLAERERALNARKIKEHENLLREEKTFKLREFSMRKKLSQEASDARAAANALAHRKRKVHEQLNRERLALKKENMEIQKRAGILTQEKAEHDKIISQEKARVADAGDKVLAAEKEHLNRKFAEKKKSLLREIIMLRGKEQDIDRKAKALQTALSGERKTLQDEERNIRREEQQVLAEAKRNIEEKMRSYKNQQKSRFMQRTEQLKKNMYLLLQKQILAGRKNEQNRLDLELHKKEKSLREKMERAYQIRLSKEIAQREQYLEHKKAELERHILSEAKRLFR